ncbi:hypothetical protein DMENIID0001_044010 [Sergentomyia squamirostris]
MCAGYKEPIFAGSCSPTAPFCDFATNMCAVNMEDPIMEQHCEPKMQICTSNGYFPDVNDARVYYYCMYPGDTLPQKYTCPVDTMFDTVTHNCKRVIPFDCTGKENQYVLHPLHSAYYAFCRINGNSREIIAYRCLDDQNFVFNLETQACEYQCKKEGVFADREDCYYFYECYRRGNGFTHRRRECGGPDNFSKERGICIDHLYCYPELGW